MKGITKRVVIYGILIALILLGGTYATVKALPESQFMGNIYPMKSNMYNLGSNSAKWKEGWFNSLYADNMYIGGVSINATGWSGYIPYVGATSDINLNAKTVTNGILNNMVGMGTWTTSGVWTLPAMTFGGDITTDRWTGSVTNTFFGINVVGDGDLVAGGTHNTAVGYGALYSDNVGDQNTAIGASSLQENTVGFFNSAFGAFSLMSNINGSFNTGLGDDALMSNISGSFNTAIGVQASGNNTSGGKNTAIGVQSGFLNNTGDRNVFIGYTAGYNETGSDKLYIDNSNTTTPLIYGNFSTDMLTINGALSMATHKINDVVDPTLAQDVATKNYVDTLVSGNLTGYVPYTGATANVSLGSHSLFITTGNIGIGTITPTARLQLPAGTAIADTAPLKFTAGVLLATPETGTIEFYNDRFYITNVAVRKVIDRSDDVITSSTTVANSSNETTVYTATIPANGLKVGNVIKVEAKGQLSTFNATDKLTINVYLGTTLISTVNSVPKNVTNESWELDTMLTVRTIGLGGTFATHTCFEVSEVDTCVNTPSTAVDTTVAEDLTIKFKWDVARAGNTAQIDQGITEFKN